MHYNPQPYCIIFGAALQQTFVRKAVIFIPFFRRITMGRKPKKKEKYQLNSGNYRIQVYDYTDDNGKRHYKSFTAPSSKLAKREAAEWKATREKQAEPLDNISLYEAVDRYIGIKKAVLSPSTVRGYVGIRDNYFNGRFGKTKLSDLNNTLVQIWISDLSVHLSPKTVRNAYGLFSAAVEIFNPEFRLKITLPAKKRPELYCPNDSDIKALLRHIEGTELEIAVLLAAFGPLRRGEICALNYNDISGNVVTVSKSMVKGPDREWIIKQPKTYGSYRDVELPEFVISKINPNQKGRIINATPDQITRRFQRAIISAGLPHFRFHDLRHYAASIMHAIGVPDQYILQRGGWQSDSIMKSVYRNIISLEEVKQNQKINQHFEDMQHECNTQAANHDKY